MEEEDGCQGVESRSSCGCGLMLLCVCVSRCVCVCMEEERRIVVSVCLLFARICVLLYLQYTTVRKALRALVWSRAVVGSLLLAALVPSLPDRFRLVLVVQLVEEVACVCVCMCVCVLCCFELPVEEVPVEERHGPRLHVVKGRRPDISGCVAVALRCGGEGGVRLRSYLM